MIAVADTSPICYLVLIGEIELLPTLFTEVLIPPGVAAVLDEKAARRAAKALGLPVMGLLGVLATAAAQRRVDVVRAVERLRRTNFRVVLSGRQRNLNPKDPIHILQDSAKPAATSFTGESFPRSASGSAGGAPANHRPQVPDGTPGNLLLAQLLTQPQKQ